MGPGAGLIARYAEPHRRYHAWAHIQACLDELSRLDCLSEGDRELLTFAIWWHDAIYDPRRSDNEARSAELAVSELAEAGVSEEVSGEVARLILLTRGHEVDDGDRLGALLVSIDLSILGASPATYAGYAEAVREEYAFVPDAAFRAGRAAILQRFLESPRIFPDEAFAARLEAQARANLAAEIARFSAPPAG
jgi:predicted metal-dependent HD superfamily phosphohydrolase